eukprot:scaffold100935_cov29-Tisochrysis_lutea.AAC.2
MHLVTNGLSNAPAQPLRGHVCESLKLTTTKRPRKGWAGALRRPLSQYALDVRACDGTARRDVRVLAVQSVCNAYDSAPAGVDQRPAYSSPAHMHCQSDHAVGQGKWQPFQQWHIGQPRRVPRIEADVHFRGRFARGKALVRGMYAQD